MVTLHALLSHAEKKRGHTFPLQSGQECLAGDLTGGCCTYAAVYLPGKPVDPEPLPKEWQRFVPRLFDLTGDRNPDTAFTGSQLAGAIQRMIDGHAPEDTADWLKEQVYGS